MITLLLLRDSLDLHNSCPKVKVDCASDVGLHMMSNDVVIMIDQLDKSILV